MTLDLALEPPVASCEPRALRHGDLIEVCGVRGRVWSAAGFCRSRHFDPLRTAELVDQETAKHPHRIAAAHLSARAIEGSAVAVADGEWVTIEGEHARCTFKGNQSPFVEFVPA